MKVAFPITIVCLLVGFFFSCAAGPELILPDRQVDETVRQRRIERHADEVFAAAKEMFVELGMEVKTDDDRRRVLDTNWHRGLLGRAGYVTAWLNDPRPPRCWRARFQARWGWGKTAKCSLYLAAERDTGGRSEVGESKRIYYEALWYMLLRKLSPAVIGVNFSHESLLAPPEVTGTLRAGTSNLHVGDVLKRADDRELACLFDLATVLLNHQPDDLLALSVERSGELVEVEAKLRRNSGANLLPTIDLPHFRHQH